MPLTDYSLRPLDSVFISMPSAVCLTGRDSPSFADNRIVPGVPGRAGQCLQHCNQGTAVNPDNIVIP